MADHWATNSGNATPSTLQYTDDILPSIVELFEPTSQNLCEFGDIMLIIEDGHHPQLRLKVNSCILASTSKVFRTLLRGCFAKGQAIRAGTREVYMNDKPRPMLALCQLLHLKPVEPSLDQWDMLEFALLVDKFDCVQPLKHATDGLLGNLDLKQSSPILHDLTASAYILDQPTHFRRFTKAVVLQYTDVYSPGTDVQIPIPTVEHLPVLFRASISHQQNAVRNELVRCLTNILDQLTTVSHQKHRPNLVYQLMTAMKEQSLWPIWPGNSGLKSLEDQVKAFSSLELPIISADDDKLYEPWPLLRVPPRTRCDHNGSPIEYASRASSPLSGKRWDQSKKEPTVRVPTLRTVFELSEHLRSLCVGLCLDCPKENDVCRSPHPGPWAAYQGTFKRLFGQQESLEESEAEVRFPSEDDYDGW